MTGRRRFMAISPEAEADIAKQAYQAVMQEYGNSMLPASDPRTKLVMRVMKRIIAVSGMTDLNWEVHVIESPEKNAFVSPGGKVFVFTGILPIAKNEDGLAVVLGHETAHQIARHTAEKLSLGVIISALRFAVFFAGLDIGPLTNSFFQFLMDLPNSRKCESEADHIGLLLTAQACFNPQEAIPLWQRMEAAEAVGVPQFLSTHPTPKNRIQQMQEWMHEAEEKRANSNCTQQLGGWADQFRKTQRYARGF
ncbi:hypothetical protein G7K_4970-t1 [Saitoella complicata NRRL Y-17804]|uniref:Peptidase M48 domain-containing protein n=2 Tax=Saitoella complicata (strain BCRC 22490 / CBS 7301 / JCM 7358 / NBRC 10748 / NRRL Y-17804) TaxID=698492 RepID=A0A0E9NMC8_SAICN|nr:hypothetical protein G7K_4970-t1 [Saitoella complicata NRRL Y-17804]